MISRLSHPLSIHYGMAVRSWPRAIQISNCDMCPCHAMASYWQCVSTTLRTGRTFRVHIMQSLRSMDLSAIYIHTVNRMCMCTYVHMIIHLLNQHNSHSYIQHTHNLHDREFSRFNRIRGTYMCRFTSISVHIICTHILT